VVKQTFGFLDHSTNGVGPAAKFGQIVPANTRRITRPFKFRVDGVTVVMTQPSGGRGGFEWPEELKEFLFLSVGGENSFTGVPDDLAANTTIHNQNDSNQQPKKTTQERDGLPIHSDILGHMSLTKGREF
jgi:hypothetical protein